MATQPIVRDEEVVGSNPATPTAKHEEDHPGDFLGGLPHVARVRCRAYSSGIRH